MKLVKIIDITISITLILVFGAISFMQYDFNFLIESYCIVGGWQVISMLLHEVNRSFVKPKGIRRIYHIISLLLLVTMPAGSGWVLFFAAPFMAVWYTYMCFREIQYLHRRELIRLR